MLSSTDLITNQPVVVDMGTGVLKAGIAGENSPKCVFGNYVGRPKHPKVMASDQQLPTDIFIGAKAAEHRGLLRIDYPMEHGIVNANSWHDVEHIWNYLYSKEALDAQAEEHPVLLTEPPLNPRKNREEMAQRLFEHMNVPALFFAMPPVLSLYASARTTGLVLDSGDGVTLAVPVYEGFAMQHSIQRMDIAGRDITKYLQLLLRKEGHVFRTSAEFDIVRTIKEKACYMPLDPKKEESLEIDRSQSDQGKYQLPDGRKINIGAARFRAPEVLFRPDLIGEEEPGVHNLIHHAVQKSDMDIRRTLWQNIVLAGGTTMLRDFGPRLLMGVKELAPEGIKIKISAPPDRQNSPWSGGSILASLSTFKKIWVPKREYDEEGPRALHKKEYL